MRSMSRATVAALALLALIPGAARAADLCVNTGGIKFVLKNFARPGRNTCRSISGFSPRTFGPVVVSGAACLNASGDTLRIGFTQHPAGIEAMRVFQVDVPYPALGTAGWTETGIRTSDGTTIADQGLGAVGPCNPLQPSIP
jgi:hypothetical protein